MSRFQRARVLGLLAVVGCILFLAGCGASVGGKSQTQTPPPNYDQQQYIAAYQQAIQGFRNNGGNVQALMFHVLTPSDQNYNDFLTNILPNVSGVSVEMPWSQIETSQGVYDFSGFDANLQPFEGSQVNLIVWPVTEGGNNDPNSGGSTPAYVFSQAWATTVGASNPQDMVVCKAYTGDSGNPFYNSAVSGGGGLWNVQSNVANAGDLSGLPISYEAPFMVAYQKFIAQVIKHYNDPGSPRIGYIRFGFSQGGENSPECSQYWPNYSQTEYLDYVHTMTNFARQQNPQMIIQQDLHSLGSLSGGSGVYVAYPDAESAFAASDGFGIGTNGLQQSDISNSAQGVPCDSDWCNMFNTYPSLPLHSLQTLQWSDPTGQMQTGSLATLNGTQGLIPFAQQHGATNLELYLADVALAFSPNYCNYPNAQC